MSTTDRVVVVTGAGRGLGLAIARRVAKSDRHVVIGEIDERNGAQAERELRASGARATFVRTDIADAASVAALAEAASALGRIEGLVNNAAIANSLGGKMYDQIEQSEWERVHRTNVMGTWLVCKHIAPRIVAGGGGSIVNLASDTALWGASLLLHYVASKGAVIAMTRGLARELGPSNVRVNALAPGLIANEATSGVPEPRWNDYRQGRLLKHDEREDDIAAAAAFLLSDDGAYITGQTLAVDGGMWML